MNPAYLLILHVLDLLTGGSLDYKGGRGGFDNRIEAGLALVDTDGVKRTETPGAYIVRHDKSKDPEVIRRGGYAVSALWGDLSCDCEDALIGKKDDTKVGICKHQIAAVVYEAQLMTFAQMDAEEQAQRSAA